MHLQRWLTRVLYSSTAAIALGGSALAQTPGMITGFEPQGSPSEVTFPDGYYTGSILFQDMWQGGSRFPRIETAETISTLLTESGLDPANPVHSGTQAMMIIKADTLTETSASGGGYFVRNLFTGLETETKVTADFWIRPLGSGSGADPSGDPDGTNKDIGEQQGNLFIGLMDDAERRAVAVRFGADKQPDAENPNPYTNVLERHIDWGTNIGGVWVKSGALWEADTWYNVKFNLDYATKTYDLFVDGEKLNDTPITFYVPESDKATRFFISRGTNQAGAILDDVSVTATPVLAGDFDDNGVVDGADFLVWQREYPEGGSLEDWKTNFGMSASQTATVGAVPEPASGVMALAMLLGLAQLRRRAA